MPFAPKSPYLGHISEQPKVIGPASTLQLVSKDAHFEQPEEKHVIPNGAHWVDKTEEGSVLVIQQPPMQTCAAIGGIMALRMKVRRVKAAVIGGRVRDVAELRDNGLPVRAVSLPVHFVFFYPPISPSPYLITGESFPCQSLATSLTFVQVWACANSTVGTNAESRVRARDIPVTVQGVKIYPVSLLRDSKI